MFFRYDGYLRGFGVYECTSQYFKEIFFGDSNLKHHGDVCQWGPLAEINITACCK